MKKYILLISFVLTSISLSLSPAFKEKPIFNETTKVTSPYKDNTNEKYDLSIKKENENTIVKPYIGVQTKTSDDESTFSIRFVATVTTLDLKAERHREIYDISGNIYKKEEIKESKVGYEALNNDGELIYATSIKDESNNTPFKYFVVYTLYDIPNTNIYKNYYLKTYLTLSNVTSTLESEVVFTTLDYRYNKKLENDSTYEFINKYNLKEEDLGFKRDEEFSRDSFDLELKSNDEFNIIKVERSGITVFNLNDSSLFISGLNEVTRKAKFEATYTFSLNEENVLSLSNYSSLKKKIYFDPQTGFLRDGYKLEMKYYTSTNSLVESLDMYLDEETGLYTSDSLFDVSKASAVYFREVNLEHGGAGRATYIFNMVRDDRIGLNLFKPVTPFLNSDTNGEWSYHE